MKKIIFIIALFVVSFSSFAQEKTLFEKLKILSEKKEQITASKVDVFGESKVFLEIDATTVTFNLLIKSSQEVLDHPRELILVYATNALNTNNFEVTLEYINIYQSDQKITEVKVVYSVTSESGAVTHHQFSIK